ncbi:N-acetylmuramoyl-L-alanine amidase [Chamaesiphon minutus]|uniref:N-acetylmuramoyl-L-alanine amidase n=1 Tax=Chamaesiphon minutus (strain ATCC 27169 / PCC 6605) TaxID=1173020 RepID=K9UKU1_CHAP6|nr:N-acetylmuramoyl-L-alanine amidase [Chamaesiphon minutus]AFY95081.1 N-acetylmuramoyl-L-alanine amidase [Chamaesiphon minutus PCC 6605]
MRYNWLLPSISSFVMVSLPATAAEMVSWQFNATENRIDFSTNSAVKPEAQMLANPSRLILDLPDTRLNQPTSSQLIGNGIKSLRVGQFDAERTRMVLEFDPDYTIDPQQVLIQASNSKQWSVQLPTPQPLQSFPRGAPIGPVAVFNENGQVVVAQPRPKIAVNTAISSVNYIAIDPTRTGILVQADRQSKTQLKYSTTWDDRTGSFRVTIPNAKLATAYQIPKESQRYLTVSAQGDDLIVFVRRADGVKVDIVRQYLDSRWVYLQPISTSRIAIRPQPEAITITVPKTQTIYRPTPKQDTTPAVRPSSGRVLVMLDPGHGGKDPGAIGVSGLREVDVILPVAKRVAEILERQGIAVKMTRNSDYFVGLDERVSIAREAGANIFISIHANAIDNRPDVNGLETYHYNIGQSLAETVHRTVVDYVNKNGFYLNDRRVRSARFLVLRKSAIPAILVEMGYLTSEAESARLRRDDYQKVMAEAIAKGIIQYVKDRN